MWYRLCQPPVVQAASLVWLQQQVLQPLELPLPLPEQPVPGQPQEQQPRPGLRRLPEHRPPSHPAPRR